MSSSYTRPCKYCNRTIQLRNMPAGQWVAFEGDEVHKCLSNHPINKTGFTKNAPENTNKKSKSDIYSDLDFFEVNVSSQPNANTNIMDITKQVSYSEANHANAKDLPAQILDVIKKSREPLRAREIAKILNKQGHMVDKSIVNQCLYGSLKDLVYQDSNYCWAAYSKIAIIQDIVTNSTISISTATENNNNTFNSSKIVEEIQDTTSDNTKEIAYILHNTQKEYNKYKLSSEESVEEGFKKNIDNKLPNRIIESEKSNIPDKIKAEEIKVKTLINTKTHYVNIENKKILLNPVSVEDLCKEKSEKSPVKIRQLIFFLLTVIVFLVMLYLLYI